MTTEKFENLKPIAKILPHKTIQHNIERIDNYHWMRAENWQEVLHKPQRLDPEIRLYLEAENKYQTAFMHDTEALQQELFLELKKRIKEDDSSVPSPDGPFAYGLCYEIGAGLPNFFRTKINDSERFIYLNGDQEKIKQKATEYFQISSVTHSPDHKKFAFSFDDKGAEFYTIKISSFDGSETFTDSIENTSGSIAWDNDSSGFFYIKLDEQHRPHEVYYHKIGRPSTEDKLIYTENDSGFFLNISRSLKGDYIFIDIHDHETSEVWLINPNTPAAPPLCVRQREKGLEYSLCATEDSFYILTNKDGAKDFKIMLASLEALLNGRWQECIPHQEGRIILEHHAYLEYLVWLERENGLPSIKYIKHNETDNIKTITFNEEIYALNVINGFEYTTRTIRFTYSSLTTPQQLYSYNLHSQERHLLKEQLIPSGHNSEDYIARRIMAPAVDGELIPISLYYHKNTKLDGSAPCLLYGYGAYGISIAADFTANTLSLVNRGFIYAIAHIRGGKEKGTKWYEGGKYKNKPNSFTDFISAGRHLVEQNFTRHNKLIAYGGSAGGLLMGAIANMAPQDYLAIIAIVPFVDVLNTMLDASLPLTPPEWPQWGNPIKNLEDYKLIASYSPYDNLRPQDYPHILALAGLTDPRVTYWEAAKWIAKLRAVKTDDNPSLLRINMDSGHAGSADRFSKLKEVAYIYSYILKVSDIN